MGYPGRHSKDISMLQVLKARTVGDTGNIAKAQRVFSEEQESELSDHIRAMDNLFHGLSAVKCRELAYRYGVANNVKIPPMWQDNQMGGNSTLIACWLA